MKNTASRTFLSLFGGFFLLVSSFCQGRNLSSPCGEVNRQLREQLKDQEKALLKKHALESELRDSLKKEINAQIEKRDNSSEQSEAKRIYYELRKARAEADYAEKKISELKIQEKKCGGKNS